MYRSQRGGRPTEKRIAMYDPGHYYSEFKYYIVRSSEIPGTEIDMTETYGGDAADREDDRVMLLQDAKIVGVYTQFQMAMDIAKNEHDRGLTAVVHGTDSDDLVQLSHGDIEDVLAKQHDNDSGNGLNEHPQVAYF